MGMETHDHPRDSRMKTRMQTQHEQTESENTSFLPLHSRPMDSKDHKASAYMFLVDWKLFCESLPVQHTPMLGPDYSHVLERFLHYKDLLNERGHQTDLILGWHWTTAVSIPSIQKHGLLPRSEMGKMGIVPAATNGQYFGDGVYFGSKPDTFRYAGDSCLLCLFFLGEAGEDHILGNKRQSDDPDRDDPHTEIIVQSGVQIVPLLHVVNPTDAESLVLEIQSKVLQRHFENGP